jgi:hypothetical protein
LLVLKNVIFDDNHGLRGHISTDEFSTTYFIIDYVMQANMGSMIFRSLSGIGVRALILIWIVQAKLQVKGDEVRGQCGH